MILKLLMKMQWRLYLHKCTEFRAIILNIISPLLILLYKGVLPAHRDVVDANIGVVPAAQFYFINVVEVNYMQLLLLLMIIFRRIDLKRLDDDVVFLGFDDFENLERLLTTLILILQFGLAKFAMEGLPNVSRHVDADFLVLVSAQPLPQTLNVNMRHRSRTLAGRNQRVVLLKLIREADAAHRPIALRHVTFVGLALAFAVVVL